MKQPDRKLGMDRAISRTDMLQGMAAVAVGSALPLSGFVSSSNADHQGCRASIKLA
jgi:hypothetical protein